MINTWIGQEHGRPQKFFQGGGQSRHFAYPVSGCERCNANGPSQNALPFLYRKENCYESKRSVHIFLKSYLGGAVFEFAKNFYFLSSFIAFAELG